MLCRDSLGDEARVSEDPLFHTKKRPRGSELCRETIEPDKDVSLISKPTEEELQVRISLCFSRDAHVSSLEFFFHRSSSFSLCLFLRFEFHIHS